MTTPTSVRVESGATISSREDIASQLSVQLVDSSIEWDRVASDWRTLSDQGGFYLGYSWMRSWWECYGSDDLFVHLGRRGSDPVFLAPFTYTRRWWHGIPVNVIGNLFNAHLCRSDVALVSQEREVTEGLLDSLDRRPWDVIHLREMPIRSPFVFQLSEVARERGHHIYLRPSLDSPYIAVDQDWSSYLKTRSKSFRKKLRYRKNRLASSGLEATFDCVKSPRDIEAILPEVMRVARVSWSGERGSSIASGRNRLFYEPVLLRLAAEGHLRVYTLRLDGELASFEIHIPWGRVDSAIKACFDPRFGDLSPGAQLDVFVMEHLFTEREFDRYDLLGTADAYKLHWTRELERHVEVFVYNRRPGSKTHEFLEFGVRPRLGAAKRRLMDWRARLRASSSDKNSESTK